jgi:acyl-CoA synthetase (AMP-forming)/AMP-acid ligase II
MRSHSAGHPHGTFLEDARSDRIIDNAAIDAAASTWSRELDALHVPHGARVLDDVDDPLAFAVVHLSVIAAGRCSAPVIPEATPAETHRARLALRPVLVITDRGSRPGLRVHVGTGLPVDPVADPDAPVPEDGPPGSAALLTSGSTGAPKTVELSEGQLLHMAGAVPRHHRLNADDRGFNPLSLSHHINAQVVGLLATLVSGATLVLDRRRHRTGSDRCWPRTTSHGSTRFRRSPERRSRCSRRSCGIGPNRTTCPVGVVGRVRIRGAGVIRGYADGRNADRVDNARWLDTADLGRLDVDGYPYLVGRADDVVNRGGELVYPQEIEEVLLDEPGAADAVVIGRPHDVLGAVPVALVRPVDELSAVAGGRVPPLTGKVRAGKPASRGFPFGRPRSAERGAAAWHPSAPSARSCPIPPEAVEGNRTRGGSDMIDTGQQALRNMEA